MSFIQDGIFNSMGIIINRLNDYDDMSSESIAFAFSSVTTFFATGMGPLAASFSQVYGCRVMSISGGVMSAMGLAMAACSRSMFHLTACMVIASMGLGLSYVPQNTIILYYFTSHLKLANSICLSGSGVGEAAIGPVASALNARLGWRYVLVAFSVLALSSACMAITFRPLVGIEDAFRPVSTAREYIERRIYRSRWHRFKRALRGSFSTGNLLRDKVSSHLWHALTCLLEWSS